MDQPWSTVLGVFLGLGATLAAQWFKSFDDERRAQRAFLREERNRLVHERKAACIRLMSVSRELRYVARRKYEGKPVPDDESIDDLRTRLSGAYYEVSVLAPEAAGALAEDLRRSVFNYWNGARDDPDDQRFEQLRHAARVAHDRFEAQVREELTIAE